VFDEETRRGGASVSESGRWGSNPRPSAWEARASGTHGKRREVARGGNHVRAPLPRFGFPFVPVRTCEGLATGAHRLLLATRTASSVRTRLKRWMYCRSVTPESASPICDASTVDVIPRSIHQRRVHRAGCGTEPWLAVQARLLGDVGERAHGAARRYSGELGSTAVPACVLFVANYPVAGGRARGLDLRSRSCRHHRRLVERTRQRHRRCYCCVLDDAAGPTGSA
jgi:hypothetical protein